MDRYMKIIFLILIILTLLNPTEVKAGYAYECIVNGKVTHSDNLCAQDKATDNPFKPNSMLLEYGMTACKSKTSWNKYIDYTNRNKKYFALEVKTNECILLEQKTRVFGPLNKTIILGRKFIQVQLNNEDIFQPDNGNMYWIENSSSIAPLKQWLHNFICHG